jgi:hypothetical protein
MRDRLPYLSAWLLVTVLATAVGLVAVNTVGIVLRGTGPIGEQFSAVVVQDDASAASATPREETLAHPAAVLRARCEGRTIRLLEMRPAPGVVAGGSDVGPDEDVHVDLVVGGREMRLEVYCNDGAPRLAVE